jgi:alpha-beta hydrolase superfamily lysophospholipase
MLRRIEHLATARRPETVTFPACDGAELEGWWFAPPATTPSTVVVMAPGLTGTKDAGLERYASRFVDAGAAVLAFDFRTLGGSGGLPRHWIDPMRQVEDYESAIAFATRELATSVVVWGSSFSGGEALVVAARQPAAVAGVIAQVPYLGGGSQQPKGWRLVRFVLATMADLAWARLDRRRSPAAVYVPAVGRPGEHAMATSATNPRRRAKSFAGEHEFWSNMPADIHLHWSNVVAARTFATLDRFQPLDHLGDVACPVLLVSATGDDMIDVAVTRDAAERLGERGRLVELPCGHFDVYVGDWFEQVIAAELAFLASTVPLR